MCPFFNQEVSEALTNFSDLDSKKQYKSALLFLSLRTAICLLAEITEKPSCGISYDITSMVEEELYLMGTEGITKIIEELDWSISDD